MRRGPREVADGLLSVLGGVDSGRSPSLLQPNQLAFGVNVTLRGGFPGTRPHLSQKTFFFPTDEMQSWFESNLLQGVENYYSLTSQTRIVAAVAGRLFTLEPVNVSGEERFEVQEITPTLGTTTTAPFVVPAVGANVVISVTDASRIFAGYPIQIGGKVYIVVSKSGNNVTATNSNDTPAAAIASGTLVVILDVGTPTLPTVWMTQANEYLIIQDGQSSAIIFDGANSRRAEPALLEVPTGTAMVYNEEIGRLVVAVPGNQIAFGDVFDGSNPASILKFEEETILDDGGRFRIPLKFGKVTAMAMTANLDRSNGQGPMIVFAQRGISSFNLPANRDIWTSLTYPTQVNMPIRYSATSQETVQLVNADLYFRAPDGFRSLMWALKEFQSPGNVPLSSEMNRILAEDDKELLDRASTMVFDNRLIFTAEPTPSDNGIYHRSLVAMDFDQISRIGLKAPPVYEGSWTSVKVTKLLSGTFNVERAFMFSLNAATLENELWELHTETGFDESLTAQVRIQSAIELRALDANRPLELKELADLDVWLDQVVGEVVLVSQYKPDDYQCWFNIGSKELCQTFENCEEEECKALQVFEDGYRTRISFGQPPDQDEEVDNKPARAGYQHQIRLAWKGQARVRKVLARLRLLEEWVSQVDKEQ